MLCISLDSSKGFFLAWENWKTNESHESDNISLLWSREGPTGLGVDQLQAEATKKAYCDAEMGKASDKKASSLWKNGWKWIGTQPKCIELNVIERLESNFASSERCLRQFQVSSLYFTDRETSGRSWKGSHFCKSIFRWFPLLLSILHPSPGLQGVWLGHCEWGSKPVSLQCFCWCSMFCSPPQSLFT